MASNLILHSGSPLIGSPIVYQVTAGSPVGDVTFQRVKLRVSAGLSTESGRYTFEFSQPVTKGETIKIDIASALQSVADKYEYTPVTPQSYPYLEFSLEACDEYMQNGQNSGDVGVVTNPGGRALMGRFSDLERLKSALAGRTTSRFSRKPSTLVEVVTVGSTYLRPVPMSVGIGNVVSGPEVKSAVITTAGHQTLFPRTAYAIDVYAVPATADSYELRFVNGLGVVESVCVRSLIQEEMPVTTDDLVIARQQMFNEVSHSIAIKQNDHERLKLSSGPTDRAWQQWFLHELLMTPQAWIRIDGMWIPCQIMPEETVGGIDRTKGGVIETLFTVRLDISGSPYEALAI